MSRKKKETKKTFEDIFKFRITDKIGAAGAEEDRMLTTCFIDTGIVGLLEDNQDIHIILLGRTGAGKSAAFKKLRELYSGKVLSFKPERLALAHISNSSILQYLSSIGVNFDPFFKELWRHVIVIEILTQLRTNQQTSNQNKTSWIRNLVNMGSGGEDPKFERAVQYLESKGAEFWETSEVVTKKIVKQVENELTEHLGVDLSVGLGGKFENSYGNTGKDSTAESETSVIKQRAQKYISDKQINDLRATLDLLPCILQDRQKQFVILVDHLDEDWVDEAFRYRLIMALIQAAKDFIQVGNVKIVVALRRDLFERVLRRSRPQGFQEEKFKSLTLPLKWNKTDLLDVLDSRVNHLVARRYTKDRIGFRELLPKKFGKTPIDDFIFQVANRPRDVIDLFNTCIEAAEGNARVSNSNFSKALGEYSRNRLKALQSEWIDEYPNLISFAQLLKGSAKSFKFESIERNVVEEVCLDIIASPETRKSGVLYELAKLVVDDKTNWMEFWREFIHSFYKIGALSLKINSTDTASWADDTGQSVSKHQINDSTGVAIHPALFRVLAVVSD